MSKTISIIVPAYNEERNVPLMAAAIAEVFSTIPNYSYELIYVNDGSRDNTQVVIEALATANPKIKTIEFSRNFGKEAATSAGYHYATGNAVLAIDADLQHPPVLIPAFIKKWEEGSDVVIGLRRKSLGQTWFKSICSTLFYKMINAISDTPIQPQATDFRLIDRVVIDEFNKMSERDRMTRGLIDWLGFRRDFIEFEAPERLHGEASYSFLKLMKLAVSSTVQHSLVPLKLAGYLGMFITCMAGLGGLLVIVEQYICHDPLHWGITGTAQLAIMLVFFIGIVLICLGLIALYIGTIHSEVSGRPLYVVRSVKNSVKI
jgi:polyisoprenyl-phosphate glycosyltransferase